MKVDENGKCTRCNNKVNIYIRANQEGECVFDTCKKYNEDGVCKKCNNYFYLNDEKKCSYIKIPYCKKLDEGNENECGDTSSFLNGRPPEEYEIAKEEYLLRCDYRNDDETCSICESGYEVDSSGKKCVLIGCDELVSPSSKCEFCENGYILVDDESRCMPVSEALGEDEPEKTGKENEVKNQGKKMRQKNQGKKMRKKNQGKKMK